MRFRLLPREGKRKEVGDEDPGATAACPSLVLHVKTVVYMGRSPSHVVIVGRDPLCSSKSHVVIGHRLRNCLWSLYGHDRGHRHETEAFDAHVCTAQPRPESLTYLNHAGRRLCLGIIARSYIGSNLSRLSVIHQTPRRQPLPACPTKTPVVPGLQAYP